MANGESSITLSISLLCGAELQLLLVCDIQTSKFNFGRWTRTYDVNVVRKLIQLLPPSRIVGRSEAVRKYSSILFRTCKERLHG